MEEKEEMIDINFNVKDMINAYGIPGNIQSPFEIREFIGTVYTFMNDVLSGYYDTKNMGMDITRDMQRVSSDPNAAGNRYIRGINAGG